MDQTMLPTCPRCASYVYADWPACKICGYDPNNPLTHTPFRVATATTTEPKYTWAEVVGGLVGLIVFCGLAYVGVRIGVYLWQHGQPNPDRQVFVTVPH